MIRCGQSTFIVTAELDQASFAWLNGLRQRHFPVARNYLDAHLTLFHRVDGEGAASVAKVLREGSRAPIAMRFSGLRKLGRGVAVTVEAPALVRLRAALADALVERLTRQDSQPFRPHVTILNKVDPAEADALHDALVPGFLARQGQTSALQIWEYLGGPWRFVRRQPI